jgi:hypothetical protein
MWFSRRDRALPSQPRRRIDFVDAAALDGDEPEVGEALDRAPDCPGAEQGRFGASQSLHCSQHLRNREIAHPYEADARIVKIDSHPQC